MSLRTDSTHFKQRLIAAFGMLFYLVLLFHPVIAHFAENFPDQRSGFSVGPVAVTISATVADADCSVCQQIGSLSQAPLIRVPLTLVTAGETPIASFTDIDVSRQIQARISPRAPPVMA